MSNNTQKFDCGFRGPLAAQILPKTNLILVSSEKDNKIFSVSLIKKQYEYVYLDLGRKQYCTVQLDH